jgi:hypothetical protein
MFYVSATDGCTNWSGPLTGLSAGDPHLLFRGGEKQLSDSSAMASTVDLPLTQTLIYNGFQNQEVAVLQMTQSLMDSK